MHLHKYEKIWLTFGISTLVLFLTIVGVSAFAGGHAPPSAHETLDPQKVNETAPFNNPGLFKVGENNYELVMISEAFAFTPGDVKIPKGATVTFIVTSKDVVHGFAIPHTNVNMMITPGHVNKLTHTFNEAGEFLILCNEYCGIGHQAMSARIEVVEK
jgi:cytochrome c oxidase subunit II